MARIHFSRLLDFISGSAAVAATTKVQKSALYKDFDLAKLSDKKLRDLIDANLPTFYIVNTELIHTEIMRTLSTSMFKDNEDYVNEVVFKDKTLLSKNINTAINTGLSKLPSKPFIPLLNKLDAMYDKALDALSKRTSYIGYRNIVTVLSADIRRLLKTTSAFIATDGNSIVQLPHGSVLVIGPTFNYTKDKVNSSINAAVRDLFENTYKSALSKYDTSTNTGFSIGNLVNAGHTAAYSDTGLIGVNMPAAQEIQFRLNSDVQAANVDKAIADLYLDSNYGIKFTQNFTKQASSLLGLQFSFTISMPAAFNTNTLRTQEVQRLKEYISGTILPSVAEQASKKFKDGILTDVIPELSASPNLLEHITNSFISSLTGNKYSGLSKSTNASKTGPKIKVPAVQKSKLVNNVKGKTSSGNTKLDIPQLKTLQNRNYSLTSLQTLINASLQHVIAANMGDGAERKILNYRTGRFAASAQVQKMSQSREGMITAFYTYMKNPYQTFEPGFAQGQIPSRDPKLLISKSIREIAATKVGNRLRAVLV